MTQPNRREAVDIYACVRAIPSPTSKKLKPHYQKVINLRYFNELSYADIAKELDEPVNNIKVKLLRAKKLLAEIIKKK